MGFIADFHIHSKYSRATSREMTVEKIAQSAQVKGVKLVGTGDFTHPQWCEELEQKLKPAGDGLYQCNDTYFILVAEVNNTYTQNGKLRRIHNMIFAPDFESVHKINEKLASYGKLMVDGRPTLVLDSKRLVELTLAVGEDVWVIPAHVWTPWFSLFGSNSGFDSIEECFGDYTSRIIALETGLSSDPAMNWRLSSLDRFTLISNSDAHSPSKLGREANCLACKLSYYDIIDAFREKNREKFLFTIEFFPQEGKYHYDGHRKCGVRVSPKEAMANNDLCPVCGKRLTVGVSHRIEILSDREEDVVPPNSIPFKSLIPLEEIIADALGVGVDTQAVRNEYQRLIRKFQTEFSILLDTSIDELKTATLPEVAQGVQRVREGDVVIIPGYDGVYGEIRIFDREAKQPSQLNLF
jgi:uncharacterized protein (TIGR00375 family)